MASLFNKLIKGRTKLTNKGKQKSADVIGGYANSSISDIMGYYRFGSYDNTFPNISRISEAMAEVLPYAVGADGKRLENQPRLIAALYNPSKQMCGVEFFETLAVLALVFPTVYILCWRAEGEGRPAVPGGQITADNISGFTFLENPEVKEDKQTGRKTYITRKNGTARSWSEDEVIEISLNVNPYHLMEGYSPSMAAKKWSNTDDYIADYQAGFFRNGAVPSGQFIITARTVEEFNEIVADLQHFHRGAGANNNVQYVHRPIDTLTGATMNAQIEWVPFQQPNNQLGLKELFEQANKKIDMTFGVPAEVKGYLQNSNYASVSVADYVFSRRVVYPKLVKIWSRFTHEMNRITGGLGFAISFDYEIPVLEDARKSQVENLTKLLGIGYTLESAVEALQLPKSFLRLAMPEENKEDEIRQDVEQLKIRESANQAITSKMVEVKKKIAQANPQVYKTAEEFMQRQVDSAKEGNIFDYVKESTVFKVAMLDLLLGIVEENGQAQYAKGKDMLESAGWDTELAKGFLIPEETRRAYDEYLSEIALSYSSDTNEAIEKVLAQAQFENWDKEQTREALSQVMVADQWRIERIARTETHRAEQLGNLTAMRELAKTTGATIWKVWHINPDIEDHCETCLQLDGVRLPLGDSFGDFKAGEGDIADAHPNCGCFLTFDIDSQVKCVNVECPNCGRHLFKSKGGSMEGVKCQGCKKRYNFEVKAGEIKAVEVEKPIEVEK